MRPLLALLAAALAVPLASAQPAPPRPYVLADAGGGVLPNRLDYGVAEQVQNAYGWSGAVEGGLARGRSAVGLRVEGFRARRGDTADLQSLLPTSAWYDASQVNALVVLRQEFPLGPLDLSVGSGGGVGYNVSHAQEAPRSGAAQGGAVAVSTARETHVLPLLYLDAAVGRRVGRTFVGMSAGSSSALGDGLSARYGLQVRRSF